MTPNEHRTGQGFRRALPVVALALAAVLAPPQALVPSKWMAEHMIAPDGPRAGDRWDPALTPYVSPIVDAMGPDSPYTFAAVRKSQQTGLSVAGIGLASSYIALAPARIGYALPTIDLLQEFNREKLTPVIEQTPTLARRIAAQTSRSSTGSTTVSKRFPGGSLVLLNANSAPDLRSRTLKIGIADEVDQWERDLEKQGDPMDMFLGRFTAFHASADWRVLSLSTPLRKGESRIDRQFEAGDQRFWHVRCPGCGEEIAFDFRHLRFEKKPPHKAHYAAQCCGTIIEHWQKAALVRAGRFIATNPDGLYPSFHVDALISQLTTWDKIAETFLAAEGNERRMQAFFNLWLGLTYEIKGDAPDHVRLMERREDYPEGRIPPLGLLLAAGADVQHSGIWAEVVAFAPDAQSWTVTARWLAGDTTDPNGGAFAQLAALYDERFEDAYGNRRQIEALAVDAGDGGRANAVYEFARHRARALAIKGAPGWGRPALGPTPTQVAVKLRSGRKGKGELWTVGTWDLKAEFYSNLRKDGRAAGNETDPPGYCHHGMFLDEGYFRQITAEHLADAKRQGRAMKVWDQLPGRANHLLDCRVYAMAMAEHLGLTRLTRDQWKALAQRWHVPTAAGDLFATPALAAQRMTPEAEVEVAEAFARATETKRDAKPKRVRRVRSRGI